MGEPRKGVERPKNEAHKWPLVRFFEAADTRTAFSFIIAGVEGFHGRVRHRSTGSRALKTPHRHRSGTGDAPTSVDRHARLTGKIDIRIDSDGFAATCFAASNSYRFFFFFAIRTPKPPTSSSSMS